MRSIIRKILIILILISFICFVFGKEFVVKKRNNDYFEVEIKGEVIKAKTIRVRKGTRFLDIKNEIGMLETSDISDISDNDILYNNQIIVVRKKQDANNRISINSATIEELIKLPGIGEKLAQRIIDYRTSNGSFKQLEELKQVSGIGKSKYEKLKEYITL